MTTSTNMVAGLSSGFDWRTMIDQLISIDHGRVDIIEDTKGEYETELTAWQGVNTMLLELKTSAEGLKETDDFYLYKASTSSDDSDVDAEDILSVSTDSDASSGSFSIKVTNLATTQKVTSISFTSKSSELGSSYAGDILINGNVISVSDSDTLLDIAGSINNSNTGTDPSGVTASIINYGSSDYRLILTSDDTGEDGISLLNGSSTNLVQKFGWKDNETAEIKNSITQGAQSDGFISANTAIKSLLELSSGETSSGTLAIDGTSVTIDISVDSLTDIKDAINTAMSGAGKDSAIVASVVSETVDDSTYYHLQIEGTQIFTDENNILNTLGILDHTSTSVSGIESENAMTTDGNDISTETLLVDVDGYISYTSGDNIQLTGTQTGGGAVSSTFSISSTSTVQDLLDEIETQYSTSSGDAVAYITSDGKIRVDDISGEGSLDITLTDNITSGQLEFVDSDASFSAGTERQRELIAGTDATVEIDGVEVSSSSNIIEDVITGVTLNIKNEDALTTITLNIDHDVNAIKDNIQSFVDSFNAIASYINTQFSYDEDSEETGGVLFGNSTLSSIKSDLFSTLTETISGVDDDFSALSLIGIEMDLDDNQIQLIIDESVLTGYIESNFNEVMSLFVGQGTSSGSDLTYISHSDDTASGDYDVHINRASTRGTETGSVDLSAGGADETLTITRESATASIDITSGMTLEDIKNTINTELDTEYAEVLEGTENLYSNALHTIAITSETTWDSVYDNGGTQAILQDNDVISFSGTTRSGSAISGEYTISDITSDSIQGLLSAIEDEFSSEVTASMDTSGKIVITDDSIGTSQISLTIDEPTDRLLDFGSVDVTQEGRYAIYITATDDGSDHLVLRNDDYGDKSFTVSQDTSDDNYDHIIYTDTSNTTDASSGDVYISDSTTWSDVYGASIINGDTITISGKDKLGADFPSSSTYTINNKDSDTIEGLLLAIESAYSSATNPTIVDAFIQDGKIYVEQTGTTGTSSITLTLAANNEGGGSLSLGSIDQATERDLDLGLINGTVTGLDVAGTIGGEAATGSGKVLSGDDDNTNTEGLSISFSGSDNDTYAGKIGVTLGIAELFDRMLYDITDTYDGYISFKQESIQNSINSFEDQMEGIEARLDRKMEMLIKKYVTMELALSTLQNQSTWLAGQISAIASWGD